MILAVERRRKAARSGAEVPRLSAAEEARVAEILHGEAAQ
jgi:hypothetical protein